MKISAQSVEWLRSSSYNIAEFNQYSSLRAVPQKLAISCTRYLKKHTHKILTQFVERFRNYGANKKLQTDLQTEFLKWFLTSHLLFKVNSRGLLIIRNSNWLPALKTWFLNGATKVENIKLKKGIKSKC